MKRLFDILFYLLLVYFCFSLYNGDYLKKVITILDKQDKQEKMNSYYKNEIRSLNNEISNLKLTIKNLELYIYNNERSKENLNETNN